MYVLVSVYIRRGGAHLTVGTYTTEELKKRDSTHGSRTLKLYSSTMARLISCYSRHWHGPMPPKKHSRQLLSGAQTSFCISHRLISFSHKMPETIVNRLSS